eukprot:1681352-Prorocentrum_lima.AAC.1
MDAKCSECDSSPVPEKNRGVCASNHSHGNSVASFEHSWSRPPLVLSLKLLMLLLTPQRFCPVSATATSSSPAPPNPTLIW